MSKDVLIAIDIGTQGTKAAAVNLSGKVLADAFEQSRLITPEPGIVEQEPEEMYSSVVNTVREVIQSLDDVNVLAIGVDGQMAGIMGIGNNGEAVTHYDSWLDTRCEKYISLMKREAGELIIETTGAPVSYTHGPKILWWKHERPDTYRKIAKFVVPTAYVAGRLVGLTGEEAYIDYSHLHFSGFGDVKQLKWSPQLLDLFGVEAKKLPRIIEPWQVIGGLTVEAAKHCGIKAGTPVVAGCGDSAATSLGAGITKPGLLFDVAGTASIFSSCVDQYSPDVEDQTLLYARSIVPGLWIPMAYINGGGMCLKWFRDNFSGNLTYEELDQAAQEVRVGSDKLTFLPHFSGRVCPNDPNARGTWIGLTWSHKKPHLYRSIMESIGYEYKLYFDIMRKLLGGYEFSHVRVIGGGARSQVFNSIKADILGKDYVSLSVKDAAIIGTAVVAGYGVGAYSDFQGALDSIISTCDVVSPDPNRHQAYQPRVEGYKQCLRVISELQANI